MNGKRCTVAKRGVKHDQCRPPQRDTRCHPTTKSVGPVAQFSGAGTVVMSTGETSVPPSRWPRLDRRMVSNGDGTVVTLGQNVKSGLASSGRVNELGYEWGTTSKKGGADPGRALQFPLCSGVFMDESRTTRTFGQLITHLALPCPRGLLPYKIPVRSTLLTPHRLGVVPCR
jgi:hypothetical protein